MNNYFSNGGTAIGRPTRDLVERSNDNGQKFSYVTLACAQGFKGESNFLDFILQGSTTDGKTFNNSQVENFCKDVKKGYLICVEYHIESYTKNEGGVNKNVEKKVIDSYRILSSPRKDGESDESSGSGSGAQTQDNGFRDPLDEI